MIRINLLPQQEVRRAAGRRQEMAVATLVAASVVFLFLVAHGWQHARLAAAERQARRLNQELAAIQGQFRDVTRLEEQKRELREKLRVIAQLEARKVGPVRILAEISNITPDKLWLTEFNDQNGTLRLTGLGVDEQTVADFLRHLAGVSVLKAVDLDETSQVDQDGAKLKKFVIRGQLDFGTGPTQQAAATPPKGREKVR
jgi:type IV pilus assembly protein PilN